MKRIRVFAFVLLPTALYRVDAAGQAASGEGLVFEHQEFAGDGSHSRLLAKTAGLRENCFSLEHAMPPSVLDVFCDTNDNLATFSFSAPDFSEHGSPPALAALSPPLATLLRRDTVLIPTSHAFAGCFDAKEGKQLRIVKAFAPVKATTEVWQVTARVERVGALSCMRGLSVEYQQTPLPLVRQSNAAKSGFFSAFHAPQVGGDAAQLVAAEQRMGPLHLEPAVKPAKRTSDSHDPRHRELGLLLPYEVDWDLSYTFGFNLNSAGAARTPFFPVSGSSVTAGCR